ncbi:MAG TPA: DUF6770 family protein [Puia sp.]|nr:DUF6770 family protein [Puia sp.]
MKKMLFFFAVLPVACVLHAQSKVFKEVGEDISTQIKAISQDNAMVGYLAFTRLERADADSFNYRVTIMDENLNDIGTVNFRQQNLELQVVSFEQNVLCLGYTQTNAGNTNHILVQFIDLNGKMINTYYREVRLTMPSAYVRGRPLPANLMGFLKFGMQIRNIPNGGFGLFYGDEIKQYLLRFNIKGELTHDQEVTAFGQRYYLRATAAYLYLLIKTDVHVPEGGYRLYVYSAKDLNNENNFDLRDAAGDWLKVLSFENDPATGDAFIAGCIINPKRELHFVTADDYSYIPYLGLFTLDLGGPDKDMKANCSYWSDKKFPGISDDGWFTAKEFYVRYTAAVRDFSGNTIFAGTALTEKQTGKDKYKLSDGVFVRQEPSGNVVLDNSVPCDETKLFGPTGALYELDKKNFYPVTNPDTRTNYMIIDDEQNIYVYNINARRVMRRIQHKDGNIKIDLFPAKEGHVMVAEYNRKEKYTRFSIEAL